MGACMSAPPTGGGYSQQQYGQQYGRPPPGYGGGGYPPQGGYGVPPPPPPPPPNPNADKPLAVQSFLEDRRVEPLFAELQAAGLDTWRKLAAAFPASPTGGAWDGADAASLSGFIAKCPGFGKPTIAMALLARAAAEASSGAGAHKTGAVRDALASLAPAGAADFLFDALAAKGYDTFFSLHRAYGVTPGKDGAWADVGDAGVVLSQFVTDVPAFGAPLLAQETLAKAAQEGRAPPPGAAYGGGYGGAMPPPPGQYPPGAYPPPGYAPPQYGPGAGRPGAGGGMGGGMGGAALGAGAGMLGGYMLGSAMAHPYGGYGGGYGGGTVINNNYYETNNVDQAGGFDMGNNQASGFDTGTGGGGWADGGGGGGFDMSSGFDDGGGGGGGFDFGGGGGDFGGGGDW